MKSHSHRRSPRVFLCLLHAATRFLPNPHPLRYLIFCVTFWKISTIQRRSARFAKIKQYWPPRYPRIETGHVCHANMRYLRGSALFSSDASDIDRDFIANQNYFLPKSHILRPQTPEWKNKKKKQKKNIKWNEWYKPRKYKMKKLTYLRECEFLYIFHCHQGCSSVRFGWNRTELGKPKL